MNTDANIAPKAPSSRLPVLVWLLLGALTYEYAALAFAGAINARKMFPLFMVLAMGSPVLATVFTAALMPPTPVLGYIAVRYWVLPNRPRDWRNTLALPLVVLICMTVACVIAGLCASLLLIVWSYLPAALYGLLLVVITGAVAGSCLFGVERLTTRLLFGSAEAAKLRLALCVAHAAGLTAELMAGSLLVTLSIDFFHVPISQTWGRWLLLPASICGSMAYLLLTWRAWNTAEGPTPVSFRGFRGAARGLVLAFVMLTLIGAAARGAWGADPLPALLWPLSIVVGWPKT